MASQRDRAALRNLFQQGAKPTGDDFADFIQSTLNLSDEGIAPGATSDDPLAIRARGASESFLDLDVDDTNTWRLSHQPNVDDSGLGFSYNGSCTLFLEAGTGNLGIGTTAPSATLTVNGDLRAESDMGVGGNLTLKGKLTAGANETDTLSLSHDSANATLEATGAGQLNLRHGGATRFSISDTKVAILHDTDITGNLTTNQHPPFVFKRYRPVTDGFTAGQNTGYSTTDYAAAIVGFYTQVGSGGYGPSLAYMAEKNGTWYIFVDVHGTPDICNVDVMFVRHEFAERTQAWTKMH
jgi:hypothetical protein